MGAPLAIIGLFLVLFCVYFVYAMARYKNAGNGSQQEGEEDQASLQALQHTNKTLAARESKTTDNDPSKAFTKNTPAKARIEWFWALTVRSITVFLLAAYLPIILKAFQVFNCTKFPDGTYTLDADAAYKCYEGWWYDVEPWGYVCVILYGLGIPLWFIYGITRTHPPFEWTKWWGPLYYPRVVKSKHRLAAAAASSAAIASGDKNKVGVEKAAAPLPSHSKKNQKDAQQPPPPPPEVPDVPPPSYEEAGGKGDVEMASVKRTQSSSKSGKAADGDDDAMVVASAGAGAGGALTEKQRALLRQREMWHNRTNLELTSAENETLTHDEKIARFTFTAVIDPFRDEYFFWIIPLMCRNFFLALVSIFFADEPVYQATLGLFVLFLYTLATAFFKPYVNPQMNKLELMTMSCACLVLFSGFLFVGEPDKTGSIFTFLAAICLTVIVGSCTYILRIIYLKLEDIFYCWNCRRIPSLGGLSVEDLEEMSNVMMNDIITAHNFPGVYGVDTDAKKKLKERKDGAVAPAKEDRFSVQKPLPEEQKEDGRPDDEADFNLNEQGVDEEGEEKMSDMVIRPNSSSSSRTDANKKPSGKRRMIYSDPMTALSATNTADAGTGKK